MLYYIIYISLIRVGNIQNRYRTLKSQTNRKGYNNEHPRFLQESSTINTDRRAAGRLSSARSNSQLTEYIRSGSGKAPVRYKKCPVSPKC